MREYGPSTYGDKIAEVYDELYGQAFDVEGPVALLVELARGGPALELGIGTGRIALPLAARGVKVHGIDASRAMVERLRQRRGGKDITITVGDFADVNVPGTFALIYVPFNTFFGLVTQDAQVMCFENVAKRLKAGGLFLIEAFVPDLARYVRGQNLTTTHVGLDEVRLDATKHDPVNQAVTSQHVHITEKGVRLYTVKLRYAFPSELDLMARIAGMRLKHRWGGWRREPFTAASASHVSVYERAP
jgi:SAM-dependent methyltransferase